MFTLYKTDDGRAPAAEYLPCAALKPEMGMAMVFSGGLLSRAGSTTKPTYISLCSAEETLQAGTIIPVLRVSPDCIFRTTGEGMSARLPGEKVTLTSDALGVSATTSGGVAELVTIDGNDITVRF